MNTRPPYEALDERGYPYIRESRSVGELPWIERAGALREATKWIAADIGVTATGIIPFGAMVADVFMPRWEAKNHPRAALLLTKGDDLSLDFCRSYN